MKAIAFLLVALVSSAVVAAEKDQVAKKKMTPEVELLAVEELILSTLSDKDRQLAEKLAAISNLPTIDPDQPDSIAKGAWGQFRYPSVRISQVLDESNFLVLDHQLWMEGVDASDLTDEQQVDVSSIIFEVRGTKQYNTAGGATNTVKHLVAINVGQAPAAALQLRAIRKFRVWHDQTGKFSVAAMLKGFKGGNVTLERLKGKDIVVPIKRLSEADQKYVKEEVRARTSQGRFDEFFPP